MKTDMRIFGTILVRHWPWCCLRGRRGHWRRAGRPGLAAVLLGITPVFLMRRTQSVQPQLDAIRRLLDDESPAADAAESVRKLEGLLQQKVAAAGVSAN
jgi:predicted LPLAT superfamily acyltransferase